MIAFHLVYFEHLYPTAKQIVYTFHMPGFLIISGYLMNVGKAPKAFARTLLFLAIPYIIMESGYVFMASLLPIGDHIDSLTWKVYAEKLLIHPLGPYWYLQTMVICGAVYYAVNKIPKIRIVGKAIVMAAVYFGLSKLTVISLSSAGYFLFGAVIRMMGGNFKSYFFPSWIDIFLFTALVVFVPEARNRETIGGVMVVLSAMGSLIWLYKYVPETVKRFMQFLGRNSLSLYVFSPIFTILCKKLVPFLQFDPTGIMFLLLSLAICVAGSLLIARILDMVHISPIMFGKDRVLSPYE